MHPGQRAGRRAWAAGFTGGAYRLAWSDEFDGARGTSADSGTWQAEIGGSRWGNQELQYYTDVPGNADLDGAGNLAIAVRRVNPELGGRRYGGGGYTSGPQNADVGSAHAWLVINRVAHPLMHAA
jgi:hypothetical protein